MTLTEFQERKDIVINDILTVKLPDFLMMIVNEDIIADVQTRLQQRGELASGDKPSYSTKPSLVGYPSDGMQQNYSKMYKDAYTTLTKNSNAKYVRIKVGKSKSKTATLVEAPGGYKQIRELGGLQTGYVDFTVANTMLRSVKVKGGVKVSGAKLTVVYGPNGTEEEKKIEGHNDRYGENILMPNAEEILSLKNRVEKQIIKYLNAGLFGK